MKRAVVILPTYNERENIAPLIKQLQAEFQHITNYRMSILVVDDNSPDGTQTVVRQLQKQYKNVYLLTGDREGLGKAYLRGMDYAIARLKANIMFEMDADHSHDPKVIPKFLNQIDQGYDLVIGSRYIKGGSIPANWGLHRKIFSIFGNLLVRTLLFHFSHHEWTSGYRAIRVPLYQKIKHQLTEFKSYTFQVAFLHKSFLAGAEITEIPIHFTDRLLGRSKIPVPEYITNLLLYLIRQLFLNPPQFFKFLTVGGIGFMVQFIIFRLFRGADLRPSLATALSAEVAIVSNFIWNNLWTFAERKITATGQMISKFIQFNVTSLGSLVIQAIISEIGTRTLGIRHLAFGINTDDIYLMIGILVGLFWNYTMYKLVIWRRP